MLKVVFEGRDFKRSSKLDRSLLNTNDTKYPGEILKRKIKQNKKKTALMMTVT